jgi:hypothetical protein
MKIQLERNLRADSGKLRCTVCENASDRTLVRTLLCHDDGSIVGDICAHCLNQKTNYIQQWLHQRAVKLIRQPANGQIPSPQKQALELFELAHQPLTIPPFYAWWWKRLTILTAETRELELARTGSIRSQSLTIRFLAEEPPIGKNR